MVAISPILLYIGMLMGAQAFQETPKSHAPAIVLSLMPHLAHWGKLQIDNSLAAAGTIGGRGGYGPAGRRRGVLYEGLKVLGGGAIIGGLVLAAIAAFVIDRAFMKAAAFAVAGRGADLLRVHARRGDRHRRIAGAGAQLPGRGGGLLACAKLPALTFTLGGRGGAPRGGGRGR